MKFETLGFHPDILKGVQEAGFVQCTPIQEQAFPECMAGSDVIAQSQTGSGKTAVFLLTIFTRLLLAGPNTTGKPRALVMVPTRELASQVDDDAVKLGKYLSMRSVAIYGGVEYNKQVNALKEGVDIVVATPGRMIDLYKSRQLSLEDIEIFVIDEADRMFDMGFAPDIMYIAGKLPKGKPRQTMLFSATIDENVRRLASRYMKPEMAVIEIEPEQVTVDLIDQRIIYVSNEEKLDVLITLLKREVVERAIIFTNMKRTAEMLGVKLTGNGLQAKVLTGDITQERRTKIIEGMKSGTLRILVATDVAARGLHIEGITHVFNYDLPDDAANYVHRIGRTARAGKTGTAYSLVCEDHVLNLPQIEKYIERKLEPEWIEDSELVRDAAPAFIARRRGGPRQADKRGGQEGRRSDRGRSRDRKGRGERQAKKEEPRPTPAAGEAAEAAAGPEVTARPEKAAEHEAAGQGEPGAATEAAQKPKRSRRRRRRGKKGAPQAAQAPEGEGAEVEAPAPAPAKERRTQEKAERAERAEQGPAKERAERHEKAAQKERKGEEEAGGEAEPFRGRPETRGRHHKGRPIERKGPVTRPERRDRKQAGRAEKAERPEKTERPEKAEKKEKAEKTEKAAREHPRRPARHKAAEDRPAKPAHRPEPAPAQTPAGAPEEKKEKAGLLKRVLGFLKKK